jgi:poly-gamma-glutamate capsule biosynthesis protein CapA/YwtB (metallophosphatase superfamily)
MARGSPGVHVDARYAACTVMSFMERLTSTDRQAERLTVFLCGDVMTGRGIDQALPHPGDARIHEPFVKDAGHYVELAEAANGPVPRPVGFSYIWGAALDELARVAPDARIVNLETSITRSDGYWREKEIHYRMHPDNVRCLTAAGIDVCVLANNHALDFGHAGLRETLETLSRAGLGTAGAGRTLAEARAPAVVKVSGRGRLVVFGFGDDSSGIPSGWAATNDRPGIDFLPDLSEATATGIVARIREVKRARDIVVASIHWGSNWGYQVPPAQRRFAHWLLDGGVDIVHGHSSHHVRPIEIYHGKLILYGCGDFLDDYEGIAGYEEFRDDLTLMYFPTLQPETGRLESLRMTPMQIRNLKANRATPADGAWLGSTLGRISQPFGACVELTADGTLALHSG